MWCGVTVQQDISQPYRPERMHDSAANMSRFETGVVAKLADSIEGSRYSLAFP